MLCQHRVRKELWFMEGLEEAVGLLKLHRRYATAITGNLESIIARICSNSKWSGELSDE